jgi:hypothetical protein
MSGSHALSHFIATIISLLIFSAFVGRFNRDHFVNQIFCPGKEQ